MKITIDQLEDHIKKGLVSDIFKAERAYYLLKKVSENANVINNPDNGNFGELFGAFQHALKTEAILSIARLFDRPNNQYPTRCIQGLLSFIEEKVDELPTIREKYNLTKHLENIGVPSEIVSLTKTDDKKFCQGFVNYYRALLHEETVQQNVAKLKTVRDKSLAHNENVSTIDGPTWEALTELVTISKDLAGVVGWAYLSTAYVINGEYILTSDAERPSRALTRLLNTLYKIDQKTYESI